MAKRFGGEYSPTGKPAQPPGGAARHRDPFRGRRRTRAGGRVNALFFVPLPLIVRAFGQDATGLALMLVSCGMLLLAAWLTREGLLAEDAYEAREVARRPAIPRKMFGSALTGAGLALAIFAESGAIVEAVIIGALGLFLHGFAFGLDPLRDKGAEGIDMFQNDRVSRVIDEAESHLAAMRAAVTRLRDRHLTDRVDRFETTAREMFRTVERDPRDLTAARKYLGVYLIGARDAAIKFAEIYERSGDSGAKTDFEDLLDDLEQNFAARTQSLLEDNRADLDVEIEVLRERLARDGLHTNFKS